MGRWVWGMGRWVWVWGINGEVVVGARKGRGMMELREGRKNEGILVLLILSYKSVRCSFLEPNTRNVDFFLISDGPIFA